MIYKLKCLEILLIIKYMMNKTPLTISTLIEYFNCLIYNEIVHRNLQYNRPEKGRF